ncbi:hypothetical protein [Streptomyces sp. NPDC059224]|uniref:hypothetical protein n=1 Tax=Streptomyces sp. NPDC059224 TaxID=3346775 RepID=UPI00368C0A0A
MTTPRSRGTPPVREPADPVGVAPYRPVPRGARAAPAAGPVIDVVPAGEPPAGARALPDRVARSPVTAPRPAIPVVDPPGPRPVDDGPARAARYENAANPDRGTRRPENPENPDRGTRRPENLDRGTRRPENPENPDRGTRRPENPEKRSHA